MKAVVVSAFGAPEVLQCVETPIPQPKEGEALIKLFAAGVNPVETYRRAGGYAVLPPLPWTPGSDGAGVIETIEGQSDLQVGSRVWLSGSVTGTYAQYTIAKISDLNPLPETVSFDQGAALGIAYGTAYHALFHVAEPNLKGPNKILIHGASGGVGSACLEFAKTLPDTIIIGTAGTEEGCKQLLASGCHHVINHKTDDVVEGIAKLTDNKGVDIVIEMLANVNLEKDLKCLAVKGRVAIVGNRGRIEIDPRLLMQKRSSVRGVMLGHATAEEKKEISESINSGLVDGTLKPLVGKKFRLEEAPDSHNYIINPSTGAQGKVVLTPWE